MSLNISSNVQQRLHIRSHQEVYKTLPWFWQSQSKNSKSASLSRLNETVKTFIQNDNAENNCKLILNSIKYVQCCMNNIQHTEFEFDFDTSKVESFLIQRNDIKSKIETLCCHRYKTSFDENSVNFTKSSEKFYDYVSKKVEFIKNKGILGNLNAEFIKEEINDLLEMCEDYSHQDFEQDKKKNYQFFNEFNFISNYIIKNAGSQFTKFTIPSHLELNLSGNFKKIYNRIVSKFIKIKRNKKTIVKNFEFQTYFKKDILIYNGKKYSNENLSLKFLFECYLKYESDEIRTQFFLYKIIDILKNQSSLEQAESIEWLASEFKEDRSSIEKLLEYKTYFSFSESIYFKNKKYQKDNLILTLLYEEYRVQIEDEIKSQFFHSQITKLFTDKEEIYVQQMINFLSMNFNAAYTNFKIRSHREVNRSQQKERAKTDKIIETLSLKMKDFVENEETNTDTNHLETKLTHSLLFMKSVEYIQRKMNNISLDTLEQTTSRIENFLWQRPDIKESIEILCCHKWKNNFHQSEVEYTPNAVKLLNLLSGLIKKSTLVKNSNQKSNLEIVSDSDSSSISSQSLQP